METEEGRVEHDDDGRKEHGVDPVEHPAVTRDEVGRVLDPSQPLHLRLDQVAEHRDGVAVADVDEATLSQRMYQPDLPDPDLIIRTAGEHRVSNFLLWQGAYAEMLVSETLWPDFDAEDLKAALAEYASRVRRFGARPEAEVVAG